MKKMNDARPVNSRGKELRATFRSVGLQTPSLSKFTRKKRAVDFFSTLKESVVVYSPGANTLYGKFEVFWGNLYRKDKLVIMPEFEEHTYMIQRIDLSCCLQPTGIFIIPGELSNGPSDQFHLSVPGKEKNTRHIVSANYGFRYISAYMKKKRGVDFCPIVSRGDLREFSSSYPFLHLHHVDVREIPIVSRLVKNDVLEMANMKLKQFSA